MKNSIVELHKNNKGFILMTSYALISVMAIYAFALFARGNVFYQSAERNKNRIIAFNMSEAGIDNALSQLADDNSYAGSGGVTDLGGTSVDGGYEVTVTTPPGDANVREVSATGHAPVPVPGGGQRAYETRTVTVYMRYPVYNNFDFAVFSDEGMTLNGNPIVDSYNSNDGPYDPNNAGSNGDIGTNSTVENGVNLPGNPTVNGDAEVGPDSDPSVVISDESRITGNTSAASQERNYAPVDTNIQSQGALTVNGNTTVILQSGVYHFDSIAISGNGRVETTGPVVFYVSGPVDVGGNGVATADDKPTNLLLFMTTSDDVSIHGGGDFFGGVYAPASDVTVVGQGDVYGAIVADTYDQSGSSSLHFDEALTEAGGQTTGKPEVISWQEYNRIMGS